MRLVEKAKRWSANGKVEQEWKTIRRNWKAIVAAIRSRAKEGSFNVYCRGHLHEENLARLESEGFYVEKQVNPVGNVRWFISWEN